MSFLGSLRRIFWQLSLLERHLLEARKWKLFLQATNEALEDRLLLILQDGTTKRSFNPNWRRLEKSMSLIVKQQGVKVQGFSYRVDKAPLLSIKGLPTSVTISKVLVAPTTPVSTSKLFKTIHDDTLEELIKEMHIL